MIKSIHLYNNFINDKYINSFFFLDQLGYLGPSDIAIAIRHLFSSLQSTPARFVFFCISYFCALDINYKLTYFQYLQITSIFFEVPLPYWLDSIHWLIALGKCAKESFGDRSTDESHQLDFWTSLFLLGVEPQHQCSELCYNPLSHSN